MWEGERGPQRMRPRAILSEYSARNTIAIHQRPRSAKPHAVNKITDTTPAAHVTRVVGYREAHLPRVAGQSIPIVNPRISHPMVPDE
ncbi:hypothetical protein H0H93_010809 [Arthromyces matolae]|nr:hypothetical protein H0H93_010809 [Arthromyces matolae]